MHNLRKFLAITLLLLLCITCRAQRYSFRHLGQSEGLHDVSISAIAQDLRGFVWVGTNAGLSIFDGKQFRNLTLPADSASLHASNDYVWAIATAPDSTLWACTTHGLIQVNPNTWKAEIVKVNGMAALPHITQMLFDGKGQLWVVGDENGIGRIDTRKKTAKFYGRGFFSSLLLTRNGQIWASNVDGTMHHYSTAKDSFTQHMAIAGLKAERDFVINSMQESEDGYLLLFTNTMGVHRFSPITHESEPLLQTDENGRNIHIHSSATPDGRTFWLGTEDGIIIYQTENGITAHLRKSNFIPNTLSDNAVHHLYCDRESTMWIGTYFGGLNQAVNQERNFTQHIALGLDGLPAANIMRSIVGDGEGRLWVGSEDGGLFLLDTGSGNLRPAPIQWEGTAPSNIQGMCCMTDGKLWIGTFDRGIFVIDTKTMRIAEHFWNGDGQSGLGSGAIVTIRQTHRGDIFVGTLLGLWQFDEKQHRFHSVRNAEGVGIHSIFEDSERRLWVGTIGHGLLKLEQENGEWVAHTTAFPQNTLSCIHQTQDGQLLIGTSGRGLFDYDPATQRSRQRRLNIPDDDKMVVCSIAEDLLGRLWICTFNGLVCYNAETGNSVFYDKRNLLTSMHFNYMSAYRDGKATMWMGTYDGLLSFQPEHFAAKQGIPEVFILDCKVEEGIAAVHFASPNYDLSRTVWYRYRLNGSSNEWTVCQEPQTLQFSHLSSGTYTLELQASYDANRWESKVTTVTFRIAPPWWLSPWAYGVYALVIALTAFLCFRLWWRQHQRKISEAMARMESEKYRDNLQSKITFFTAITHEIRTPLTLIMAGLERVQRTVAHSQNAATTTRRPKNATDAAQHTESAAPATGSAGNDATRNLAKDVVTVQHNAQRLLTLVNQLLDFRRIESQQLLMNFTLQDISAIVRTVCTDFQPLVESRHVRLCIDLPESPLFVLADEEALKKMITNQIGNALKFCDSEVCISTKQRNANGDPLVCLIVSNDGPRIPNEKVETIFQPFEQYHDSLSKATIKGSGLGLPLTRSLANMHGGNYYYDTTDTSRNTFILELKAMPSSGSLAVEEGSTTTQRETATDNTTPATDNTTPAIGNTAPANDKQQENKPAILLVDDESDLRRFVAEELAGKYTVLQAENGQQALQMLKQHNVSLIVTDIMMPITDGVTLCRLVKENETTSHIPVMMLTAKTSADDHISALNSLADAYIEKPFVTAQLVAQIDNILHNRELMRKRFISSPYAVVADVSTNATDQGFMKKLDAFIHSHLQSEDLSVDLVAEHMAMSKSTFYRKTKAVTSLSPLDYIRLCRLKEAAHLLTNCQMTIKAVSERLCFSSTSYFTSCFMKQFGITPADFVKQAKQKQQA